MPVATTSTQRGQLVRHTSSSKTAEADVFIISQPAEEIAEGALAIFETGALKGVAAIFGPQVDRKFLVREVVAQEGPVVASTDTYEIELVDTGGHGARPREAADPIVGAGALIGALQTTVSRRLNPALAGYRGDCACWHSAQYCSRKGKTLGYAACERCRNPSSFAG